MTILAVSPYFLSLAYFGFGFWKALQARRRKAAGQSVGPYYRTLLATTILYAIASGGLIYANWEVNMAKLNELKINMKAQ